MIYLASPYSHPDPAVREQRFQAACRAVADLICSGQAVFSPIVHSHRLGLPTDWAFWEPFDQAHLVRCDELAVLTLPGWEDSVGVAAEIALARALGQPVRYLAPQSPTSPPVAARTELGPVRQVLPLPK
jgi:hypothetical protein